MPASCIRSRPTRECLRRLATRRARRYAGLRAPTDLAALELHIGFDEMVNDETAFSTGALIPIVGEARRSSPGPSAQSAATSVPRVE